ncbi:MAG: hypothetical protein LUD02_03650 [Tannerellaceae bacterium]|nr:hypothetical protein [Tannerellaceae bacterium]MCD8263354.1 hypothetical protein [Tannerellaceae bacterium]
MNIQGFLFGGLGSYNLRQEIVESYDVLYLTYAGTLNQNDVTVINNWLDRSDNRVLVVQFDSYGTNRLWLNQQGFTSQPGTTNPEDYAIHFYPENLSPFTLSPEAPVFLTDGVFGKVTDALEFRCYDTTHGEITPEAAHAHQITPILLGGRGGIVLGLDMQRGIIYCGDLDLYYSSQGAQQGTRLTGKGTISNEADILLANLWAWVANRVLQGDL